MIDLEKVESKTSRQLTIMIEDRIKGYGVAGYNMQENENNVTTSFTTSLKSGALALKYVFQFNKSSGDIEYQYAYAGKQKSPHLPK